MAKCWTNGTIYTMEQGHKTVEAVMTEGGRIIDAGDTRELKEKFHGRIDEVIDLGGGTMFPGFVDSHIHLIGHGETFLKLQLSGLKHRGELLDKIAGQARRLPPGTWIIGEGWNENEWEEALLPTRVELDRAAPNHPVMLRRVCRHVLTVNTLTLQETGVNEDTEVPSGGVAGKGSDGCLDGIFKEQAQDLILHRMPGVTQSYLETALRMAIEDCWRQGITGCHTEDLSYYGGCTRTLQAFQKVIMEGPKKFRTHLLIHHLALDEWLEEGRHLVPESEFLEYGAMKLFADGSLGGRTALLSRPYADDPTTSGVAVHSDEELDRLVAKARSAGLAAAAHAIGDGAAEKVLRALAAHPCPAGRRDRLIHGQILRDELLAQLKELPAIVDIQPSFVTSDFPWVLDRVGDAKGLHLYAWQTLLRSGIPCAGGSDAPIESVSPILGIYAAVTRMKPRDAQRSVYGPDERLSMYEAITLYTTGSAYAAGHELDRGRIQPGYAADFTVLERDPFGEQPESILENKVRMTVVDETIVYG
ncbi:amidohydrolase [Paenibacillus sp. S28]|uniref:amidohydrolase n=1 Tax=Paenibacillus sp. S28 TaxID=2767463 RepID=UPI0019095C37|nr:amidohydrolase [Paenibacillus sp. S28]MBJ9992651.1 amidohydrolase [Paenibacillus sp. S28]